ncbi:hypothetical protein TGS27_2387 [Geobacillus stearothermophilus]|uniref:Uncharacterized protein n=1 Tax=Geobacillus stearothermophilus TaxID=1422 RepID=A0ABQ7HBN8_GEOSE|nr:hypothetical protein GS8_3144 [Geobacillus stearothermophilus]OAO78371.1 hypothetical protein TGS27_2387 [Geobacillus stearothermophilus]
MMEIKAWHGVWAVLFLFSLALEASACFAEGERRDPLSLPLQAMERAGLG